MDIQRISKMEAILDETNAAIKDLNAQLQRMEDMRERMLALFDYYGEDAWYEDREGELPANVKAGVLSEDLVYDAITDLRDTAFRMLELSTEILRDRV